MNVGVRPIYQDLSLAEIEKEYRNAMKDFPIQG